MDNKSAAFKWLWLVSCFGTGNKRLWDFLHSGNSSYEAFFEQIYNSDKRKEIPLTDKEKKSAASVSDAQVSELISYCDEHNIGIILYSDDNYPERLKNIFNPPAVLFYRGDLECLDRELILSIVGTRNPSDYSIKIVRALVRQLCEFELTIVSGFALGIDINSHLTAVRNGGKTIAVLGCGLDYDYPAENMQFRDEIIADGLFLSEYFPKTRASHYTFPQRNRILSGLSIGTAVIEASAKSGSLITANLALQQGRDIFTIPPHNLFETRYHGNISLLRDGAIPIFGIQDIIYEYYENYSHKLINTKNDTVNIGRVKNSPQKSAETKCEKADTESENEEFQADLDLTSLSVNEQIVMNILIKHSEPKLPDEIALLSGINAAELLGILTSLELDDIIVSCSGNTFSVVSKYRI